MHRLKLYGKVDCCLCDRAKEIIERLQRDYPLVVEQVDITADPEIFERYKEIIPVVVVDDRETFSLKISEYRLRRILSSLAPDY
jgi:hypothetical protein